MGGKKQEVLQDLADAVVEMDEEKAKKSAQQALQEQIDAYKAIMEGLSKGMEVVSEKFESEEYFVPEVLMCSDAMYAGLEILRPHLKAESVATPAKIIIGVVEGDTHDIGKNLVKMMMETAGFEMHDLGRDVSLKSFVEKAQEVKAEMICMSTLMTTSMGGMKTVIDLLKSEGIRNNHKVMIGGGPISQSFANMVGADGYAPNTAAAVRKAKELLVRR